MNMEERPFVVKPDTVELFNRAVNEPRERVAMMCDLGKSYSMLCNIPVEMLEQVVAAEEAVGIKMADAPLVSALKEGGMDGLADLVASIGEEGRKQMIYALKRLIAEKKAGALRAFTLTDSDESKQK